MLIRSLLIVSAIIILALMAACTQATPVVVVETVVVKETVPVEVEKTVEVIITKEIEKEVTVVTTVEVPKEVTVVKTVEVEVEKEVTVVETVEVTKLVRVEVQVTPTPTLEPTADRTDPKVREVLDQVTLVQHHYDPDTQLTSFSCASQGLGLNGIKVDPRGPRYVGPNSADFDLWGEVALFKISSDGSVELVPEQSGDKFIDPEGIEHTSFTREQALEFFASGDARWLGTHGEPGRIGECDPQFKTPTPTS